MRAQLASGNNHARTARHCARGASRDRARARDDNHPAGRAGALARVPLLPPPLSPIMPTATYAALVHAPLARIWELLLEKVYHPERTISAFDSAATNEAEGGARVERLAKKSDGSTVREVITVDSDRHTVVFELADDERYTGSVMNCIFPSASPTTGSGAHTLVYTMDWRAKRCLSDEEITQGEVFASQLKEAVLAMKNRAES